MQATGRLAAAAEMLGEREERVAELEADVADLKELSRAQLEQLLAQLAAASQPGTPARAPSS